ncbi:11583_t:CDS:2, partial [Funneliformis geosporum]
SITKISNIETVNITEDFPLRKEDYLFVRYGSQVCIRRVKALYFEAYNHHCYTDTAINDLNDILYISLHIFVPLHLELFTEIVKEGCYILMHQISSNIIYHIRKDRVDINGNFLKLIGDEKSYYFDYFGRKDVIEKMLK